jgi:hypothetical protein
MTSYDGGAFLSLRVAFELSHLSLFFLSLIRVNDRRALWGKVPQQQQLIEASHTRAEL